MESQAKRRSSRVKLRVALAAVTCSAMIFTGQPPAPAQPIPSLPALPPASSAWENPWLTFINDHHQPLRGYLNALGGFAFAALVLGSMAALAGLPTAASAGSSAPGAGSVPLGRPYQYPTSATDTNAHKFTVTVAGVQRTGYVAVGKNYRPGTPAPLLLVFHGKGGAGVDMSAHSGFPATGAGSEAIIVYAQSNTEDLAWEGAPYSTEQTGDDVAYVHEVINFMKQEYTIDSSRIYATGLSNGGGMAGVLSCQASGTFAAIATVAAPFYSGTAVPCETQTPIPVLLIHGTKDSVISYAGGQRWGATYPSVHEVFFGFARRNGCASVEPVVTVQSTITSLSYPRCPVETTLLVDSQGEHNWTMVGLPTAQTVWDFLSRQRNEAETDL